MKLSDTDLARYRHVGHLTVPKVFTADETDAVVADIQAWGEEFLADLPGRSAPGTWTAASRPVRCCASSTTRTTTARRCSAWRGTRRWWRWSSRSSEPGCRWSSARSSSSRPRAAARSRRTRTTSSHSGPNDLDGLVTAWIALDDATLENGCLYFGEGTNLGPVYAHEAPADEPFNLQLPDAILQRQPMLPAPVPRGGVSFHHGNTFHQSAANLSTRWRRACALHYVNAGTRFVQPALPYDDSLMLRVS